MRISNFVLTVASVILLISNAGAEINANHAGATDREVVVLYYYIVKHVPAQSPRLSYYLAQSTVSTARRAGMPVAVLAAVQQVESGFHVTATSRKDALGPMQVHYPTWGGTIGLNRSNKWMLYAPLLNVETGTRILKSYLQMENGNLMKALFRYLGLPDEKIERMNPDKRYSAQVERINYVTSIVRAYAQYESFTKLFSNS